jgi:hypothetical protein
MTTAAKKGTRRTRRRRPRRLATAMSRPRMAAAARARPAPCGQHFRAVHPRSKRRGLDAKSCAPARLLVTEAEEGSSSCYRETMATASEDAPALREPSHGRDAEFPCDRLCAGCGRLTAPRDMTPYRPGRAGMRPAPCPHCREVGLVDLGPAAAILALEGILARGRPGRASSRRRIARRAAYAGSAVASWGLLFVFVYAL